MLIRLKALLGNYRFQNDCKVTALHSRYRSAHRLTPHCIRSIKTGLRLSAQQGETKHVYNVVAVMPDAYTLRASCWFDITLQRTRFAA